MKIHYINSKAGKLFSFHRHDYKTDGEVFIDGGFDYTRTNTQVFEGEVDDLIEEIRRQFRWLSRFDKDRKPLDVGVVRFLHELSDDHILAILNEISSESPLKPIFLAELKYRQQHGISNLDGH